MNEINASGGVRNGHRLELYKLDNRSETQTALTEYRRACADESIPMFVAVVSSKDLLALYEVAKSCNMAKLATTSGSRFPQCPIQTLGTQECAAAAPPGNEAVWVHLCDDSRKRVFQ